MMKLLSRLLLTVSCVAILGSMATCYFGVRYAINQIPPEDRARMTDTDWVGSEWIGRGMYIFFVGCFDWIYSVGWVVSEETAGCAPAVNYGERSIIDFSLKRGRPQTSH